MRNFKDIAVSIVMFIIMAIGIMLAKDLIIHLFPQFIPLLKNNSIVFWLFVIFSVTLNIPLISVFLSLMYGIFWSGVWYIPVLQALALEVIWYMFCIIVSLVIGSGVGICMLSNKILDKITWLNFRGSIGRKTFFLRMLIAHLVAFISVVIFQLFQPNTIMAMVLLVVFLLAALMSYSTYAKRFHDLGCSGFWSLGVLVFNIATTHYVLLNLIVTIILLCAGCFIKGDDVPTSINTQETRENDI